MEQFNKTERQMFSETLEYLKSKYEKLKDGYVCEEGGAESCILIAVDVARLILKEGGRPEIVSINGKKIDSSNTKSIFPALYKGRVKWGAHMVCVNEGIVYDPMVGYPLELSEYLDTVFSEPVDSVVRIPQERIVDFVK